MANWSRGFLEGNCLSSSSYLASGTVKNEANYIFHFGFPIFVLYTLPLHCVSSYLRGNNDAYDTNKMAEDFTHQFLDQAFSVGQQVQLQRWQLFSEIRASHVDFFHILTPYHIQKQLQRHSRKFWISLGVSKLGDLVESTAIHLGFRVSCWFKLKIFYVYFPINGHLRQLLLNCFSLVWGTIVCLQAWVGRGSTLYVIYSQLHAKGFATLRFRIRHLQMYLTNVLLFNYFWG